MMERVKEIEKVIGMDLIDYCSKIFEAERKIKRNFCRFPEDLLEDYVNGKLELYSPLYKIVNHHINNCTDCLEKVIKLRCKKQGGVFNGK